VLLADQAFALKKAGLHRLTVSLDTLRSERFAALSRRDMHARVMEGLATAASAEFSDLRIDCVVLRGVNEDELPDLVSFAHDLHAEIRFIEYMDVAGATRWSLNRVVSRAEMLERLSSARSRLVRSMGREGSNTAERFVLDDGTIFGIISSTTEPFCRACDRSRLSADGQWFRCLYATEGTELGTAMRKGATDEELKASIVTHWSSRADRGAELRRDIADRQAFVPLDQLRKHPHWEMHKKGG
jgi:cyclic pyranopterin phosphate synthase